MVFEPDSQLCLPCHLAFMKFCKIWTHVSTVDSRKKRKGRVRWRRTRYGGGLLITSLVRCRSLLRTASVPRGLRGTEACHKSRKCSCQTQCYGIGECEPLVTNEKSLYSKYNLHPCPISQCIQPLRQASSQIPKSLPIYSRCKSRADVDAPYYGNGPVRADIVEVRDHEMSIEH